MIDFNYLCMLLRKRFLKAFFLILIDKNFKLLFE